MKVKTVETFFKVLGLIWGVYMAMLASVAVYHTAIYGEKSPLTGTLRPYFRLGIGYAVFIAMMILGGLLMFFIFGIKPEVETKITITPKVGSQPISITPKKKKP